MVVVVVMVVVVFLSRLPRQIGLTPALTVFAALMCYVPARLSAAFCRLNRRCRGIVPVVVWRAFAILLQVRVVTVGGSRTL